MPAHNHHERLSRDFAIARSLSENAHTLALLLAADGTIVDLNQHMADSLAQPIEALKGTLLWFHLPPEHQALRQAMIRRVVEERQPCRHDTQYNDRWYDSCLTPCMDDRDQVIGVSVVAWDITERKKAEQDAERRFAAMADAAPVLIWASGADRLCTYFNKPWLDFTGRTLEQEMGNGWSEGVHPDDRARCLETYESSFDARKQFRLEYRLRRYDGQYRWLHDTGVPSYHPDGGFSGYIGSAIDVTEAKQAEQALQNSAAYTRTLIEASLDPLLTINTEGKITDVNEAFVQATGVPRLQVIGTNFSDYVTEPAKAREGYRRVFAEGAVRDYPLAIQHRSGRVIDVLCNAAVFLDAQGQVLGVFAAARDITERKRAEEALRASEAKVHAMIDASPVAMAVNDEHANITFLNRRFVKIFGYTLEDIPTVAAWWPLAYPDPGYRERNIQEWQAATEKAHREGTALQLEDYQVTCKDGSVRDIRFSLAPLGTSYVVILYDITERNQLEERLRQSQKLKGIGQLAGGMAHEFNNVLAAMMMNLNLAERLTTGTEVQEYLHETQALCRRSADLVKQLLAFSRRSAMRIEPMDLAAAVSGQCNMLDRLLGEGINLAFSNTDSGFWVSADKTIIEQVLLNLCLNARDSMKHGGLIRLDLTEVEIGAEQTSAHAGAQPGKFVCLSVADAGCGMDEQTMKRLFEPFFTTKAVGQGSGLGLATVHGMIQQHHGWVEVESRVGEGSTFRVYLPAVAQPLTAPPISQKEVLTPGSGTILLVEDELTVRKVTRLLLVQMGYVVLEAADGREALAIWETHRAAIDLIYTDMVMPGDLTGLQLVEQILADKPGVKAIITSGYNTDLLDLGRLEESSIVYLPKPSPAATLISAIQECLQRA